MGKLLSINENKGTRKTMAKKKKEALSDVSTVADIFLTKESMTHKKLQKLCYYAYAVFITALEDKRLFDAKFEAWIHGPVCVELYDKYMMYGVNQYIPQKENMDEELKDELVYIYVNKVYETFGKYSADELEEMTHRDDPWQNARKYFEKGIEKNNEITDKDIIEFYGKQ